MALPYQPYTDLASASTDASGSVPITHVENYRKYKLVCTCAAAITWTLSAGVVTGRQSTLGSATDTSYIVKGDDGPWPYMTISWSGNAGGAAVYIDIIVDDSESY